MSKVTRITIYDKKYNSILVKYFKGMNLKECLMEILKEFNIKLPLIYLHDTKGMIRHLSHDLGFTAEIKNLD